MNGRWNKIDGRWPAFVLVCVISSGCLRPQSAAGGDKRESPAMKAFAYLKAAVPYRPNAAVRAAAVEALEASGLEEARPWIRSAMADEHPAVRFAACMAVGRLGDTLAESVVAQRLEDADASVRIAALFARHRLGHPQQSGRLATYLLTHEDVSVRRNAALALGMLGEKGAVKILARAMRDEDAGVRQHALEAMARLGNREARQELTFMTNAGVGSDEVFAITALSACEDRLYTDTFRYKLVNGTHLETKLAAARALGRLGLDDGYATALRAISSERTVMGDPNDPPDGQRLRAKQMACAALGEIGRDDAIPSLMRLLETSGDPRVEVSAAGAILQVLNKTQRREQAFPLNHVSGN